MIVTIANAKGGVAKTTTAVYLSPAPTEKYTSRVVGSVRGVYAYAEAGHGR